MSINTVDILNSGHYPLSKEDQSLIPLLRVMKTEAKNLGIDFLDHVGIRVCLQTGFSLKLTTNILWNDFVRSESNFDLIKDHYSYYLKYILDNELRYQLRRPEDANTRFLKCLAEYGMCNSLTVFTRLNQSIVAYFFVASPKNSEAISLFYNKLHLFDKVAKLTERRILDGQYLKDVVGKSEGSKIINEVDRYILFNKNLSAIQGKAFRFNGQDLFFTEKEVLIINTIAKYIENKGIGYTLKSLARDVGIGVSGINFHIGNIKKKVGIYSKDQLIEFISSIKI